MRSSTMIAGIVLLFALNIVVDSVLYIVSVLIDGLTLSAAAWLGWQVIKTYRARLAVKDARIAELEGMLPRTQEGLPWARRA